MCTVLYLNVKRDKILDTHGSFNGDTAVHALSTFDVFRIVARFGSQSRNIGAQWTFDCESCLKLEKGIILSLSLSSSHHTIHNLQQQNYIIFQLRKEITNT